MTSEQRDRDLYTRFAKSNGEWLAISTNVTAEQIGRHSVEPEWGEESIAWVRNEDAVRAADPLRAMLPEVVEAIPADIGERMDRLYAAARHLDDPSMQVRVEVELPWFLDRMGPLLTKLRTLTQTEGGADDE